MLYAAEEDIQKKKRNLDLMETSERQASDNFSKLSASLERLTSSIADGFSLLGQVMHPPPQPFNMPPYQTRGPYGHILCFCATTTNSTWHFSTQHNTWHISTQHYHCCITTHTWLRLTCAGDRIGFLHPSPFSG